MKKVVLSAMVVAALALTSCDKLNTPIAGGSSFNTEASAQEAMVFVSSSDYQKSESAELVQSSEHGAYTSGAIEYLENGEVTNRIEFGEGNEAVRHSPNGELRFNLRKKGAEFEKVVVDPIVKSEDCDCIVAGKVEFFKNDEWVATVDFGDGECDAIATKTWADGSKEIELECGKEKGHCKKDMKGKPFGKGGKKDVKKIIVEEIVTSDDCDCFVAGVVEYHHDKDFIVTVNYGDGACDNIATKSFTKDGVDYTEEFEMDCNK